MLLACGWRVQTGIKRWGIHSGFSCSSGILNSATSCRQEEKKSVRGATATATRATSSRRATSASRKKNASPLPLAMSSDEEEHHEEEPIRRVTPP